MGDLGNSTYKLRCALMGHSMDVRGVASGVLPDGQQFIASASRDKTSRVWLPSTDGSFQVSQINEGHTKYVTCIFVMPPTPSYPQGLILTGGHDHSILGFQIGQSAPIFRLVGHHGNVCALDYSPDGLLVSASWDCTAKVWRGQDNIETLTGHEAAVWSVAFVPGPIRKILTGSADRQIRLWINSATVNTYTGHTDCVRTILTLDHSKFLSSSNDASIRLWNIETAETLNIFYGHTNYIYSMARFQNTENFVTVGEDRTLRIWSGSDCKQVIHLPATSVWSVATMKDGDIVTGSSDGVVRVFTCDPARKAHPDVLAAFEEEVASSTIAAQQELGGMKISDLPGPEVLLREGKRDGDTTMVREGSKVTCYSWSAAEHKWSKVGDVVGASGATQSTSGKQLHDGQEYDYVFTIELDDKTSLKLPYNITEDPWFVAQKFIHKHNLPQLHLDQVANFITKNTEGMQLGTATAGYEDPFTGGNRYVPGSGSSFQQTNGGGGGVDPFTGAGAYRTPGSGPSTSVATSSTAPPPKNVNPEFPILKYLRFAQEPNYQALSDKLEQFIKKLEASNSDPNAAVKTCDVDILLSIGKSKKWTSDKEILLEICLSSWPDDCLFPIFDLLRIGVMEPVVANDINKKFDLCGNFADKYLKQDSGLNQMLILRMLCNLFGILDGSLMEKRSQLISYILNNSSKDKRNQVSAATLLLNYSIALISSEDFSPEHKNDVKRTANVELYTEILMALISIAEVLDDPEAIYRTLVGFGNLISKSHQARELLASLGGESLAKGFKLNGLSPKIQNCADQILTHLSNSMAH